MPSALLVINGSRDALFEPDGRAAPASTKLAACYAKAGVPEKLRTRLYDTPARVQRRDAGRGLGVAAPVALGLCGREGVQVAELDQELVRACASSVRSTARG